MNLLRRKLIKSATFIGAVATVGGGLLVPGRAIAAYNKAAFAARDVDGALTASLGGNQHSASDAIKLKAPDIAENGAVVPVTVTADMDGVEAISIVAAGNAQPLTSTYMLSAAAEPYVSTRIKMGTTSNVVAVIKSNGNLYSATKEVKVTIGGCGG